MNEKMSMNFPLHQNPTPFRGGRMSEIDLYSLYLSLSVW